MTDAGSKLLREALELPAEVRAEMASELIASLDRKTDEDVQKAWAEEIIRRADAARAGELRGEDWRPLLQEIERDLLTR